MKKFKCQLIAIEIAKRRWQKLGHILRINETVSANEAMIYTHSMKQSFRGKHKTTIVTQLIKYIDLVKTKYPGVYKKFKCIRRHSNYQNVLMIFKILDNYREIKPYEKVMQTTVYENP